MPYKDADKEKEANRERVRRYREKQKGVTSQGVTTEGVTPDGTFFRDGVEYVPAAYVPGIKRQYEVLPERPRYLTLSDGQVLDRLNQPEGYCQAQEALRRANDGKYGRTRKAVNRVHAWMGRELVEIIDSVQPKC